jgi:hypothetical protein
MPCEKGVRKMYDENIPVQEREDTEVCIGLMKSGEYPRDLLENDDPDAIEEVIIFSSFKNAIGRANRYSFFKSKERGNSNQWHR